MEAQKNGRLIAVTRPGRSSDSIDLCDPETGKILFESRETGLGRFSKFLRFLGGDFSFMSAVDYNISDVTTQRTLVKVRRVGRLIGNPPSVAFLDGNGNVLAKVTQNFGLVKKRWLFSDGKGARLFDLSIERTGGFVLSITSVGYKIFVDDVPAATIEPYKGNDKKRFGGKRVRILNLYPLANGSDEIRSMVIGSALALERIIYIKHR